MRHQQAFQSIAVHSVASPANVKTAQDSCIQLIQLVRMINA
jgi:hypothetical protein